MTEHIDGLELDPFSWKASKTGRLEIMRGGRVVVVLGGRAAEKLLAVLHAAVDERDEQLILAKATGNYKRGNERRS